MKKKTASTAVPSLACESRTATLDDEDDGTDECIDGDEDGDEVESFEPEINDNGDGTWDHLDGDDECLPGEMQIAPAILEAIAEEAYREAKLDCMKPNILRLAKRFGWRRPEHLMSCPTGQERAMLYPKTVKIRDERFAFHINFCWPPQNPTFATAHVLGHWLLQRHGYAVFFSACFERDADYLAAALLAPKPAFLAAYAELGPDLPALAARFSMKEVGVALRMGEVLELPIAVISSPDRLRQRIRLRGPENWRWPDERTLLEWAEVPKPGIVKIRFTDDPSAVMLDASRLEYAQVRS